MSLWPHRPGSAASAFSGPEYRDEFLRGQIRLTLVSVYRDLERSSRVDQSEGEARHIVLGAGRTPVHYGGSWHNPIHILSLSNPVVDKVHLRRLCVIWPPRPRPSHRKAAR